MNQHKSLFIISGKSAINMSGGLGAYAYNLANIFSRLGFKVSVLGFSDVAGEIERDNITFQDITTPFNGLKGLGVGLITPYFLKALKERIAREKPREIIVFGMATWNYVGIRLKKQLPGQDIKTMVSCFTTHKHELMGHIRGAPVKDYGIAPFLKYVLAYVLDLLFIQHFDRIAIRKADRIIMHYQSSRQIIENDYGPMPPDRLRIIPYCVELYGRDSGKRDSAEILLKHQEKPKVVVICRQDPRKGMNTFMKAVRLLKQDGVDFDCLIVGAGPFLADNIRLAKRLGLEDDIRFPGFVDDVKPFLLGADVYVLPSVEEGAGAISLLEAMKLGIPIVTTRCDGIPEDFTHERNALLVDMDDQRDIALQIRRILEDGELKMRLSENARKDYQAKFRFEYMLRAVEQIVQEL